MMLTPLNDRIIIDPVQVEITTASGLVLPETAAEKPNKAIVVAVSDGIPNSSGTYTPLQVKVGDSVVFNPHAGIPISDGDNNYLLVAIHDVYAVQS
jgi:chaperonin GroES